MGEEANGLRMEVENGECEKKSTGARAGDEIGGGGGAGGQACLAQAEVAIAGAVFPRCAIAVADGDCGSVGSNFGFLFLSGDDILMVIDEMLVGRFYLLPKVRCR